MRRSRAKRSQRHRRSRGDGLAPLSSGTNGHGLGGSQPTDKVRHWREREKPAATATWQSVALFFLGAAAATAAAALTLADDVAVRPSELWVATGGFVALALTCFIAHRDANRGRKSREYVLEEVPPGE